MAGANHMSNQGNDATDRSTEYVEIDGVRLALSQPYSGSGQWIGQQEILMRLLACWIACF